MEVGIFCLFAVTLGFYAAMSFVFEDQNQNQTLLCLLMITHSFLFHACNDQMWLKSISLGISCGFQEQGCSPGGVSALHMERIQSFTHADRPLLSAFTLM
ncbi:hypothetical protein ATANTOWER_019736 [Ataeniobius toweri]|uniref:Uncharacterized protein n=1 Tax=Ataeniobius toweri TaxID=208326 RepID=A0ABU7AYR3_9TELE|nr:hypothetical protein [Ataeniobius toweri]